ncbi:4-alpha-glucanotransferase [Geodermatophilus sp. Leaf369]|uniref:4-alpha-glucanotransferase n=1 Tax=Geodermatophilus sp. Leaf369 TaxID=1736354 RepID=UPI0007015007|nr:4-alpha-glucanotransferase [Geodermatophilus sp. Leaf369]KQS59550.1 4-alpha-glucanotransferase [Geodermatophilus sp. Leaf369]
MSQDPSPPVTDRWGIDASWLDALDTEHTVEQATIDLLREVIGEPPADLEDTAPIVVRPGDALEVDEAVVVLEDGTSRDVDGELPEDFPLGYHRIRTPDGRDRLLVVTPGRCWLPEDRSWGWAVQLYAARGTGSAGIGDLADLRTVRELAESQGAGFVLVNPLHAVGPGPEQEDSPYLPATRRFRNPLYLRLDDVPGVQLTDADRALAAELNGAELIDRDAVWAFKRAVLERSFDADAEGFRDWWWHQGQPLQDWATWAAVADAHGANWPDWPAELQDPRSDGVRRWVADHEQQVAFHAWLQWLLDGQLSVATGDLTVIQDLPIGVSGGGADAWAWQDVLAQGGVSVGAPPDAFNAAGQDWGSPPLVPWRLRAADYEPFVESIRSTMAGAGGLRIDHVMGLFRLWWVPGNDPTAGAYVRYPAEDMLGIVALESHRAKAVVVGEDLGTVEDGVREAMAEHGVLSYRLLWFEDDAPSSWPAASMGAITTHDLPTVAGLWTGSDVREQVELGTGEEEQLEKDRRQLLAHLTGHAEGPAKRSTPGRAVEAAHRLLATAPCTLLSATLDDALAVERRPNVPGAMERPNWRLPLPVPVEELAGHRGVRSVARALGTGIPPL